MKYFSDTWITGGLSDEQCSAVQEAYAAPIQEIRHELSPEFRRIATNEIHLHDGLIRFITLDRAAECLSISLRCGDFRGGYFDVDLVYADVELNKLDPEVLRAIATDPATELLYAEIDLESCGRFVHRIIFWPKPMREIEVVFGGLKISTEPRPDRGFGTLKGAYCENL